MNHSDYYFTVPRNARVKKWDDHEVVPAENKSNQHGIAGLQQNNV